MLALQRSTLLKKSQDDVTEVEQSTPSASVVRLWTTACRTTTSSTVPHITAAFGAAFLALTISDF
uniref:Uncharacterized protein n=1 Tax=Hyaloperonospora arabidopsidis (strain Emoy2) TaxID=559515 RepID=M4B235_HYAAE